MLTLALVLSLLLLALAAMAAFGLPYLVMGPRAFAEFGKRPDLQAAASALGLATTLVVALPFAATGLISAGPQLQVFAEIILGDPRRIWG